jgi:hypothetical protein
VQYLYYRAQCLRTCQQLPGIEKFLSLFAVYHWGFVSPVDRSGVIKFPVHTRNLFPLPQMCVFTKNYEQLCDERARKILAWAEHLDVSIYAFWSGGIDSTLVLVSLLKNATVAQRERIVVVLDSDSIAEYPDFYRDYIRGQLRRESATNFPHLLGGNDICLLAEHNDQLFGSDVVLAVMHAYGHDVVHARYDRRLFAAFFAAAMKNEEIAQFYVDLFERLKEAAPIPLKTNHDMFWWINFAVKWQSVYWRTLSYIRKKNLPLSPEYINTRYVLFYNTPEFQLWSMNNLDKRIRRDWRSYKWPAKEIIYKFTKDADYRDNKIKRGSLYWLVLHNPVYDFIDEKLMFHKNLAPEKFYNSDNDFISRKTAWN